MSTSLNVAKVLQRVMQKPRDAGMSGNSGNTFSSVTGESKNLFNTKLLEGIIRKVLLERY